MTSIFKGIATENNQEKPLVQILKRITVSILESVNLNDGNTLKNFKIYSLYRPGLTDLDILQKFLLKMSRRQNYDEQIESLWTSRALEAIISELDINTMNFEDQVMPCLYEFLVQMKSIESITLFTKFKKISPLKSFERIEKLSHFKELDICNFLFNNKFTYEEIKTVFIKLSKLQNLRSFKISQLYLLADSY